MTTPRTPASDSPIITRGSPIYVQVYRTLRAAIARGELLPGSRLIESDLAAPLKVSRAPVREALRMLAQDGLVRTLPNKGTIVNRLSLQDIREVYTCRAALEGMAVQLCAQRPDRRFIDELEAILDRKDEARSGGRSDEVLRLNNEFYQKLIGLTENRMLLELVTHLWDRIVSYRAMSMRFVPQSSWVAKEAHRQIVAAIRSGDGAWGRAIAERRVLESGERLIEYLTRETEADPGDDPGVE